MRQATKATILSLVARVVAPCAFTPLGSVRRAVWPLRLQSGLAAAEPLLKEVTLIPT